jgi:triosephosphate isomerase
LKEQLDKVKPSLKNTDFGNIVVAYEPVWVNLLIGEFNLVGDWNRKSCQSGISTRGS